MASRVPGEMAESADCAPNISPVGRRTRLRFGRVCLGFAVAATGTGLLLRLPWAVRACFVAVPAALSAVGFLQARRSTCVMRAAEGSIEHDDRTATPAPPAEAAASRRMSWTIVRDALLFGVLGGGLAAATALAR